MLNLTKCKDMSPEKWDTFIKDWGWDFVKKIISFSHKRNWRKIFSKKLSNLHNINSWMIKVIKTPILPNIFVGVTFSVIYKNYKLLAKLNTLVLFLSVSLRREIMREWESFFVTTSQGKVFQLPAVSSQKKNS